MKNYGKIAYFTFITEKQDSEDEALKLSEYILLQLGNLWKLASVEKYYKFDKSYKIEIECSVNLNDNDKINNWAIVISDKILSPWLVFYDDLENSIELIFNKNENSKARKEEFSSIFWAHLQISS